LLRFWCAPLKYPKISAGKARVKYFFSFYGMVDLVAISPIILAFVFPNLDLVIVRILRLMRFVKISQYNNALQDLFEAVYHERRSFFSAAYIFALALLLSASLAYFAENEAQPENFSSIPEAMWWSIITLTTVGYGDVSPVTAMGKVVGAVTALLGVCSVALLTGIVANAFSAQLSRKRAVFENAILRALQDGVISSSERDYLHKIRDEFNLTREYADAVFEKYVKDYGDRKIKQPNIDD
jgi:voltage-gated potassium channel